MALKDILVIDTGGTFSMKKGGTSARDKQLVVADPIEVLAKLKSLASDFRYVEPGAAKRSKRGSYKRQWHYHPLAKEERIDSSAATPYHWHKIAQLIHEKRHDFGAFVVIHGTDTLMYVSAGLSFLLPDFPKPVIVTGAQVPLLAKRASDAANNFLGSLAFADWIKKVDGQLHCLSGVFVYFDSKLISGTAAIKVDSERLAAFDSPRAPLVGEMQVAGPVIVRLKAKIMALVESPHLGECKLLSLAPKTVAPPLIVHLFPGIILENFRLEKYRAVILAAYGCGNGPKYMKRCLTKYLDKGGLVAVVSECLYGKTSATYGACIELWDLHPGESRIAACRCTSLPAAFAKTCVYLGSYNPREGRDGQLDFKKVML